MQHAAVFAFPSFREGFGLPVLEAFAAGTPVVCSQTGSLPEVAGDAAVLVNPLHADALGAALNRLLVDEAHRCDLIARGRARARAMNWDACADAYLDFFKEIL